MSVFLVVLVVSYLIMLIDSTIRAAASDLKVAIIVLSVDAASDEECWSASDVRQPDRILRHGPALSSPGDLLKDPGIAPSSMHRSESFLCVARSRIRSSLCLSDVTGGASGGATPPSIAR
jgi:hypothetical protein